MVRVGFWFSFVTALSCDKVLRSFLCGVTLGNARDCWLFLFVVMFIIILFVTLVVTRFQFMCYKVFPVFMRLFSSVSHCHTNFLHYAYARVFFTF